MRRVCEKIVDLVNRGKIPIVSEIGRRTMRSVNVSFGRMKLKAYIQITRPFYKWIIYMVFVSSGMIMGSESIPPLNTWFLAILVCGLYQSFVRSTNDYFDKEIDMKQPSDPFFNTRMLALGYLTEKEVLGFATILFASFSLISWFLLNKIFFLCGLTGIIMALLYSAKVKKILFLNNIFVSGGCLILPIVAGFCLFKSPSEIPWLIVFILWLGGFAGTITKDLTDITGDKLEGVKTFPVIFGTKNAIKIMLVWLFSPMVLAIFAVLLGYLPIQFAILGSVFSPFIIFSLKSLKNIETDIERDLRRLLPISVVTGWIGTVLAAIVYVLFC